MTNTNFNIIGKVTNGRATVIVASEGRIVGHSRKITRTNTDTYITPVVATLVSHAPIHTPVPHTPPATHIDSPFISMANDNYLRTQAHKKAHTEHMIIQARKARIKRTIIRFFNGE